jgi:hypothetical protein
MCVGSARRGCGEREERGEETFFSLEDGGEGRSVIDALVRVFWEILCSRRLPPARAQ